MRQAPRRWLGTVPPPPALHSPALRLRRRPPWLRHTRPQPHPYQRLRHTYARGSDDHPIGVGASCARFMRRWNLRYPRAGHRLVGRQHLSFVEVRLRRNRLRAGIRGVGYEARQRADAAFVATLRGWGGLRVRGVRQRPPKARQTAHGSEAGEPARRTLVKRGLDDD